MRNRLLKNYHITWHQKYVLCTETKYSLAGTSDIVLCVETKLSTLYITNVYCAQKQNSFHTVHQNCVLCTETVQFPHGTSEMCTVHRNNNFQTIHQKCVLSTETKHSTLYIRNVYCAQKQNNLRPPMCI